MINLDPVIVAVITLAGAVLTAVIVPLIRRKMSDERWQTVTQYAVSVVQAAEIIFGAGHGKEKLHYAVERLEKYCQEKGMILDAGKIKNAVEAAWKAMKLDIYHPKK